MNSLSLKNQFSFRLGTSSYIIEDDIIPNIKYLANKVDDIEILLFESDEISNLPNLKVIDEMNRLAKENNLTYNIHLPIDIALGSLDEKIRKNSLKKCLKVIELMDLVNPLAYILHLTGNVDIMGENSNETIVDWLPSIKQSLTELLTKISRPEKICIETLSYPFYFLDDLITKFNLSICLDIGHIIFYGYSFDEYLKKYLKRTKVIHLHGIFNGKDHHDISHLPKSILDMLFTTLKENKMTNRILTLEIFNEKDFLKSINILKSYL